MAEKRRDRKRRSARRPHGATREPLPIILVVTEGECTEPEYLRGFQNAVKNPRVIVETHGGKGSPKSLVEFAKNRLREAEKSAKREQDDNLKYDQVWCVFDVDEHKNLSAARETARQLEIQLAISNPCIEIWLWLHFAEQPGAKERHEIQSMMKTHIAGYDKHVNYIHYQPGYENAVRRAQKLDEMHGNPDESPNPSTGVWRLTETIRTK